MDMLKRNSQVKKICLEMYLNGVGFLAVERVTGIHHSAISKKLGRATNRKTNLVNGAAAIGVSAVLLASLPRTARACEHPGTPNHESSYANSPTSIVVQWTNTAREGDVQDLYFDLEGAGTPSIGNLGPFRVPYGSVITHEVTGLQTGHRYGFRIWARDGNNGCRSNLPSAWTYAEPVVSSKPPVPLPTVPVPGLSLAKPERNTFVVTGRGFLSNAKVHLRVTDDALTTIYVSETANATGNFTTTFSSLCRASGNLHFSANDGRSSSNDLTGTLWSNTVTGTCVVGGRKAPRGHALKL